jgi:lipopolysaccharide transport system ATP-binding protein
MGAITVTNLGKAYKSYPNKWSRVLDWFSPKFKSRHSLKWVLKEVTFAISPGESVGIIGLNGAGKSTLLKLIVGTLTPSEGEIYSSGSVVALLELGMGFHPEFTGKQNVYMAAQLQGLSAAEVDSILPEIEAFAESGEYIDRPLREYSSGMQMRLAFAVATCKRPDILIVDEALSVGDSYFQHKCSDRIRKYQEMGTTFLFVSHSPEAIKSMCKRAILLKDGNLLLDGNADEVMDFYNGIIVKNSIDKNIRILEGVGNKNQTRSGTLEAEIINVDLLSRGITTRAVMTGDEAIVKVKIKANQNLREITAGFLFRNKFGSDIFGTNTFHQGLSILDLKKDEVIEVEFLLPALYIGVGDYSLSVALHSSDTHIEANYDWWDRALIFNVILGGLPKAIGSSNLPLHINLRRF